MEIYRNFPEEVTIAVPTTIMFVDPVTVTGTDGTVHSDVEYVFDATAHTVTLTPPLSAVSYDGQIGVSLTLSDGAEQVEQTQYINVTTPYASQSDIDDPDFTTMDAAKFNRLERFVHKIIDTYTGQRFGLRKGSSRLIVSNNTLVPSERVVSLDSPIIYTGASTTSVAPIMLPRYYDYKADVPVMPSAQYNPFYVERRVRELTVTGTFGYEFVPFDVREAAVILMEEFGCDESLWRDRYLVSMKSSDWRIQYSPEAYVGTGSVNADQLLGKYITAGPVVI
jgi:hypothetical protein